MSRRGLYSIAPNANFLETLAGRILDGTLLGDWPRSGPFWLSDVTIVLPTRRARLTLAEIFFARRQGGATLLPDIRTFGGDSAEEEMFLPPDAAPVAPSVTTPLERRLVLSRLVRHFAQSADGFASPPNAAEILWLADSLGELIDDLEIEGVAASALEGLVEGDLAENWQDILKFLRIALDTWPGWLAPRGKIDAAAARNVQLRQQAASAKQRYGSRPVIAAGSTGSIPATAELLRAIAVLPGGALVLPGLDTSLSSVQHEALLAGQNTQGHPQYGLALLLRRLGAGIGDVEELAATAPRTQLLRTALALADDTAQWASQRLVIDMAAALDGVSILAAPNADSEARAIALAARDALAAGRSVGIVSRDQNLARRIAAELRRFGIATDDPAGTPLYQSAVGRLLRQMLALAAGNFGPVDTIALLRNAAVTLGLARIDVSQLADRLDMRLRGKRPLPGLAGLHGLADSELLHDLIDRLGAALQPLTDLASAAEIDAHTLVAALQQGIDAAIGDGDLPGLAEFRRWAAALLRLDDSGAPFPPVDLDGVLKALLAGSKAQNTIRRRDDIHIWGELEARLQNPDLMILAAVNEDIWPGAADPGPWLGRGMRIAVGLEPPERQQGQAAHDFEMAVGNGQVMIAYAERLGASPALPSRFVQRLDAFIGATAAASLRARAAHWLDLARALDATAPAKPATRPVPRPPLAVRPKKLSITEIETLVRSPYDLYARHVLRLRRREPLGQMPEARERGTMIHEIFAQFVTRHDVMAPDALALLLSLADDAFSRLESIAEQRDIWLRRFARTAEEFLEFERDRNDRVSQRLAEREGLWTLPGFRLSGRADRIDFLADGQAEIIDFKTGTVPSAKQMREFDAPQLLLEAAMLQAGAFDGVPARPAGALTYIKIGLGPNSFMRGEFKLAEGQPLAEMIDEAAARMQRHVAALLLSDTLPMAARIRPDINRRYAGDYDHLARTDEWTLTAESGE